MQGILWKWTNYLSGWQPRWFVLDNGVLSYYKSQEDVNNGCKGSLQMAVCDIAVHNTDHTRLDLIIPGEQHFYVKASTPHERQRWLVAMGTCKASLASGRPAEESGEISPDIVRTKKSELRLYCDLLMQQVHSVKSSVQESRPDVKKLDEATSLLSATCDTFIKSLEDCMKIANASIAYEMERSHQQITDSALPNMSLKLPQKKGDKLSSSLSGLSIPKTRRTLLPGMKFMVGSSISDRRRNPTKASPLSGWDIKSLSSVERVHGNPKVTKSASNSSLHSPRQRTTSENSYHSDHSLSGHSSDTSRDRLEMSDTNNSSSRLSRSQGSYDQPITNIVTSYSMGAVPKSNNYLQNTTQSVGTNVNKPPHDRNSEHSSPLFENGGPGTNLDKSSVKSLSSTSVNSEEEFKDAVDAKIPTFFSTMTPSFMDIKLEKDGGIPTQPFLASCRSLVPIFDKFNATAFAPVKMDFQGNIRKIQQKHSTNSDHFSTLQKMVQSEIQARQQHLSSSATVALLWMKRGLEFIREILREICEGQPDLSTAVNNAYGKTLKPFHGWVIRGVFAVAAKALPYKEDFVAQLHAQGHPEDGSIFLQSLMADIDNYGTALDVILNILNDFYKSHSLDIAEQI